MSRYNRRKAVTLLELRWCCNNNSNNISNIFIFELRKENRSQFQHASYGSIAYRSAGPVVGSAGCSQRWGGWSCGEETKITFKREII